MPNTVRLVANLPDSELNGLDSMADELLTDPEQVHVAIVHYDVSKIVENTDEESKVPYIRVRRFEPVGTAGEMPPALQQIVEQAAEDRTGKAPLPYDAVDGIEIE